MRALDNKMDPSFLLPPERSHEACNYGDGINSIIHSSDIHVDIVFAADETFAEKLICFDWIRVCL